MGLPGLQVVGEERRVEELAAVTATTQLPERPAADINLTDARLGRRRLLSARFASYPPPTMTIVSLQVCNSWSNRCV